METQTSFIDDLVSLNFKSFCIYIHCSIKTSTCQEHNWGGGGGSEVLRPFFYIACLSSGSLFRLDMQMQQVTGKTTGNLAECTECPVVRNYHSSPVSSYLEGSDISPGSPLFGLVPWH